MYMYIEKSLLPISVIYFNVFVATLHVQLIHVHMYYSGRILQDSILIHYKQIKQALL